MLFTSAVALPQVSKKDTLFEALHIQSRLPRNVCQSVPESEHISSPAIGACMLQASSATPPVQLGSMKVFILASTLPALLVTHPPMIHVK